jgi:hypothetical protein
VLEWVAAGGAALYGGAALRSLQRRDLSTSAYPSPQAAEAEIDALAREHPGLATVEEIGRSSEGRPIRALRLRAPGAGNPGAASRPRLLVTSHIHAVEYVGSFVAREVARRLAEGYGRREEVTALLDRADVCVAALLNPDGAERVWRSGGFCTLGGARFTARGVDPNRNFPFVALAGRGGWNTGRDRPGSAYYRGPHPLSEPECLAIARLARRERFCGAVNFHSFGGVVYLPAAEGSTEARHALAAFQGPFQSRQRFLRYRPVPERSATITGQLDAFLLGAFGTPSATIEVSRPGLALLRPGRLPNVFWIANPPDPAPWAENDADAAIVALAELLARTGGRPCAPTQPELAERVPD